MAIVGIGMIRGTGGILLNQLHYVLLKFIVVMKDNAAMANEGIIREIQNLKMVRRAICPVEKWSVSMRKLTRTKRRRPMGRFRHHTRLSFGLVKEKVTEIGSEQCASGYMEKANNSRPNWSDPGSWCNFVTEQLSW